MLATALEKTTWGLVCMVVDSRVRYGDLGEMRYEVKGGSREQRTIVYTLKSLWKVLSVGGQCARGWGNRIEEVYE